MAHEFRFPDVGEGITEGEIVEWKVAVRERIVAHQTLVVMETDKAVVDIPSPVQGVIIELRGEPGDMIPVGEVLAVIGEPSAAGAGLDPDEDEETRARVEGTTPKPARGEAVSTDAEVPTPGDRLRRAEPPAALPVTRESVGVVGELEEAPDEDDGPAEEQPPAAQPRPISLRRAEVLPRDRQLARRLAVDVDALRGTGRGGRVTESDVRMAASRGLPGKEIATASGEPDRDPYGPVERVPVRGVRRKIAEAMVRSLATAAQVTTTDEARIGLLWHILQKERDAAARGGARLTILPFVIKTVVSALKRDPYLNASLDDEAGEVHLRGYYNIGVAVQTRDGLIVPNVKGADGKTILEIAREVESLSTRARERTLEIQHLKGGSFTISNYGSIGGLFGTPILNPPEVGLLGLGRAHEKPVAVDGAIKIERVLPLSLTFDHRVVDGATAQHFMNNVVRFLEDPDRVLLGG